MDSHFVEELASGNPTPGGGAACAYVGVLSTCLTSMVGNLTVGKERYKDVEDDVKKQLHELEVLRDRLTDLVDEDMAAFAPLAAAYRMPKDTEEQKGERAQAIQLALYGACEVPLQIMEALRDSLIITHFLAYNGNRTVLSDVGGAAALARAAAHGARMTLVINVRSIKNEYRARSYTKRMNALLDEIDDLSERVESYVMDRISS